MRRTSSLSARFHMRPESRTTQGIEASMMTSEGTVYTGGGHLTTSGEPQNCKGGGGRAPLRFVMPLRESTIASAGRDA